MRCAVTLRHEGAEVVARCREFPGCEGRASTTTEALGRLRASVVFWLEACPCDQTADHGLELEVVEDSSGRASTGRRP
jgi:predicted RNase H-like HicB family nuclease